MSEKEKPNELHFFAIDVVWLKIVTEDPNVKGKQSGYPLPPEVWDEFRKFEMEHEELWPLRTMMAGPGVLDALYEKKAAEVIVKWLNEHGAIQEKPDKGGEKEKS